MGVLEVILGGWGAYLAVLGLLLTLCSHWRIKPGQVPCKASAFPVPSLWSLRNTLNLL